MPSSGPTLSMYDTTDLYNSSTPFDGSLVPQYDSGLYDYTAIPLFDGGSTGTYDTSTAFDSVTLFNA